MESSPPEPPAPAPQPASLPATYSVHAIHLVRTAVQANLSLSQMADQKASILMGATFVVFTIAVGQASRGDFSASLLILAFFAFLSAFCAVFAVLPSVRPPSGPSNDANLMFFGVFSQMSEDEFATSVLSRLGADETVFRTMLRDIYQNGQVLQRKKYRFLGYAYRLFLIGLTVTFIAFLMEHTALFSHIAA
jgi:hypothetical protein